MKPLRKKILGVWHVLVVCTKCYRSTWTQDSSDPKERTKGVNRKALRVRYVCDGCIK